MADVHQQLANIQNLVYQLVEKCERAENESEILRKQNQEMAAENTAKTRELDVLQQELKTLKTAHGLAGNGEETEMAKAKIGSLVREIDRCIALLNE